MFSHIVSLFDHNSWTNYPIKLKFELDLYFMILNNCTKIEYNPLIHSQVIIWKPSRDRQTDGRKHTHQTKQRVSHDTWTLSVARYKNHQSFDRHPTTKTQMNKNKNGQDNHQTFPDFGQYMVPRAEQIMLTLPEHLMILPVFVGVHTASALFFVAFVFNSVYLFCPCYFYCLFLCNLCMAMFLDLWPFVLLLRYSFADIFMTMTIILKSSWQFKCLGNIQSSGGDRCKLVFHWLKLLLSPLFKIQDGWT